MNLGKKDIYREKRNEIISKIIHDREYDIPEWVYDYVTPEVIMNLLKNESIGLIFKKYIANPLVRDFYDTVRDHIRWSKRHLSSLETVLSDSDKSHMLILLLNEKEWSYIFNLNKDSVWYGLSIVELFKKVLLTNDIFIDRAKTIFKASNVDKEYLIRMVYVSIDKNCDYIDRLIKILEVNKSYELCEFCHYSDIPVLFKYADYVDLYMYLRTIIVTKWVGDIDENIVNIEGVDNPDIVKMLGFIGEKLNNKAIKLLKIIHGDTFSQSSNNIEFIDGSNISYSKCIDLKRIVNFGDYITIYGENNYGLPIEIQEKFIKDGGDIRTMFRHGELLPEASIIKTMDKLSFLIDKLDSKDIGFLLKNSSNFVMNVISNYNFTQLEEIKILRSLFVYPIDIELWKVLNSNYISDKESGVGYSIDYREVLINKFIGDLTLAGIFSNIPKAMLYIKPSTLYVTRYFRKDNIPYIPVEKLIPYIDSIIADNDYTPLNLFSNGKRVSITNIMNMGILIQNIVKYNKYGYICDITEVEPNKIIDILCKMDRS